MPQSKHRILHLFVSLPMGGAENLLLSTLRLLDPEQFSSVVCCIGERGQIGDLVQAMGVPLIELHLLKKGGFDRNIVTALVDLIHREKIDLVHSHLYHANFYGRLAANKAGVPAIISIHNTYTRTKLHRQLINWYLARKTAAIITGSEEIRRDVIRYDHVPESLVELIPNAIDLSRSESQLSQSQARKSLDLPEDALVLGTVGRLEEQKGHRHLIKALALLHQQGIDAYLLIVGDGREKPALTAQTQQLGLEERVKFLGTRQDLGDLFRAMDLFVMPSLWEGLSLAMLSAIAAGLPLIATDVGGVRNVLGSGENGFIVAPGNPEELANKIAYGLGHPEKTREMAARGKQKIHATYSDRVMVNKLQKIYCRTLNQ